MTETANVHYDKTQLPEELLNLEYLENVRPRIFILIYEKEKVKKWYLQSVKSRSHLFHLIDSTDSELSSKLISFFSCNALLHKTDQYFLRAKEKRSILACEAAYFNKHEHLHKGKYPQNIKHF